jgi:hypothetical protein
VLPRTARRQIALVAAILAVAGCAGNERPPERGTQPEAATDEIRWLERLQKWEAATDRDSEEVFTVYSAVLAGERRPEALMESLRPVRRCSAGLRAQVGEPPPRYTQGYALMLRACEAYERYAAEAERSFQGDTGEALLAAQAASEEADALVLLARRAIENRLTANRKLPRVGGDTERSRIEPLFSRVASSIVGRRVEVVCWSPEAWPKALREWGAYIGRTDLKAFAHYDRDRAYLDPDVCEGLVDLAYRKRRPTDGKPQLRIADSVSTLGHEAEHLVAAAAGEAETECYGMQDMRRAARMLGASSAYADDLAELYWEELYETLPDEYVAPDCYDGGPWDRNDASSVWP